MANVPYNPIADVAPDARAPEDYQRIEASPAAFGGAIAQGAEKFGAGAVDYSKFWGQVQTDDVMNKVLPKLDANLTTFRTLEGQAALDGQDEYQKTNEQSIKEARAAITSPDQQLAFDRQVRPYAQRLNMIASTHVADQTKTVVKNINDTAYGQALNHAATYYDQPDMYKAAVGDMTAASIKNLHDRGLDTPEARAEAARKAQADAAKGAAEAAIPKHPDLAIKILDGNAGVMDPAEHTRLYLQAEGQRDKQGGISLNSEASEAVKNGWRGKPPPGAPVVTAAAATDGQKEMAAAATTRAATTGKPISKAEAVRIATSPVDGNGNIHQASATAPAPASIATGPAANIDPSIPPEGRALLATIGGPEAGGQYNVRYGGAHFEGYGDHPRIHQKIETGPNAGRSSDAAGRYQILSSTWDQAKNALGLTDFSPASQDKGAWWIAQKAYHDQTGGDLLTALRSGDPAKLDGVARALHGQWTSLPGGIEEGTTTGKFAASYSAALQGHGASTQASREPAGPQAQAAAPVAPSPPAPTIGNSPESVIPNPAALSLQPPPAPVMSETESPEAFYAHKVQYIEQSDKSETEKKTALAWAAENYRAATIAAQATEREKTERVNEASADYTKRILTGNVGPNIYAEIANDPRFAHSGPAMEHMAEFVTKWTGKPPTQQFGKGYADIHSRLFDPGRSDHITDFGDVIRLANDPNNGLTPSGVDELYKRYEQNARSADTAWVNLAESKALQSAKKYLSFDGEGAVAGMPDMPGLRDPEGVHAEMDFAVRFSREVSHLKQKAAQTHDYKELDAFLADSNVKSIAREIRSEHNMNSARMTARHDAAELDEAPPAPADVGNIRINSAEWSRLMSAPPIVNDKIVSRKIWGKALTALAANPTAEMAASFDKSAMGHGVSADGLTGAKLIQIMTGSGPMGVGRPENVGATVPSSMANVQPEAEASGQIQGQQAFQRDVERMHNVPHEVDQALRRIGVQIGPVDLHKPKIVRDFETVAKYLGSIDYGKIANRVGEGLGEIGGN